MAKISTRLVPDQDHEEVHQQLLRYLEQNAPNDIRWEVKTLAGNPASISDRNNPGVQAMARALETVWGQRPYFKREGGSIPVVGDMQRLLGSNWSFAVLVFRMTMYMPRTKNKTCQPGTAALMRISISF